jgi:hypothetical protein
VKIAWERRSQEVTWHHNGLTVKLVFDDAPRSVHYIGEADVVVVVEAFTIESPNPSNAVVYNLDGTERLRLQPPVVRTPLGFDQVFPSRAGVEAVFSAYEAHVHGHPDFESGVVHDWQEWR